MNCLILFVLLFCCQGKGGCKPGCGSCIEPRKTTCNMPKERDCGCRNEFKTEPRFVPYPAGGCGCEMQEENNCDCR